MTNVVFASNNKVHFPGCGTSQSYVDVARVPYSLTAGLLQAFGSPIFSPVVGDVTWTHVRFTTGASKYTVGRAIGLHDASGREVCRVEKHSGNTNLYKISVYDGVTRITSGYTTLPSTNVVDIKLTINAFTVAGELYIGGVLIQSAVIGVNAGNSGPPTQFVLGGGTSGSSGGTNYFSEIIVADGDTRNARVDLLRPVAAGAYSEWDGAVNTLADDDPTTGVSTIDPNKRQSVTLGVYGGSDTISNVVAVAATTRGANSPTQLNQFIRLSGVDYDQPAEDVAFGLEAQIIDYGINPATSVPWTAADLAAIEVGFQSLV